MRSLPLLAILLCVHHCNGTIIALEDKAVKQVKDGLVSIPTLSDVEQHVGLKKTLIACIPEEGRKDSYVLFETYKEGRELEKSATEGIKFFWSPQIYVVTMNYCDNDVIEYSCLFDDESMFGSFQ